MSGLARRTSRSRCDAAPVTARVFTAELPSCQRSSCTWFGSFTAAGKTRYAELADGGPQITARGTTVAAVDTGDQQSVFPKGGGTSWEGPATGLGVAAAVLLAVLAGQVAVLRRAGATAPRRMRERGRDVPTDLLAAQITAREVEVLERLASARSTKDIAAELFLSPRTVERHISNLAVKLGVDGRAALVAFAAARAARLNR
jgi:DNA-binding CsgD family transcriptional regulator